MSEPLVTIVTPSYNQGRFIRATIESVLSQDYARIEYIIMDGGSTDETAAVVSEYSNRLTWISEKDRGQSHAINKGFQRAQGSIVAWINSDDTLLPGAVRRAVAALRSNPHCGAVYGEGDTMDESGRVKGRFPFTEPFNLWKLVHHTDYILQQSCFFRRALLEQIGWLDESLHYGMDWDLLIRIARQWPLCYVPEGLGCLREYETAKSFAGGAKRFRELKELMRRHSGRRFPPGYVIYGLDTYDKLWCAAIERWTPRGLRAASRLLQRYLSIACRLLIDRTMHHAQGCYRDGWAAPTLHWMLPPGSGTLEIKGALPDLGPHARSQTLRLFCDGKLVTRFAVPLGPFDFRVPLPRYQQGRTATLRLEASRWGSQPTDPRRLAYRLTSIDWA